MKAGMFLRSTSLQDDTYFEQALIFVTEHNAKGAMGFVVNKLFSRRINELVAFKDSVPFPLYEGGPVDQEHLFFIHQRPDLIKGGDPVTDNIHLGGDFKAAMQYINDNTITEKDVRIFIGYCGWDFQELEAEIAEGSWEPVKEASVTLF
jgi:putative transcriptional regulator